MNLKISKLRPPWSSAFIWHFHPKPAFAGALKLLCNLAEAIFDSTIKAEAVQLNFSDHDKYAHTPH